MHKETNVEYIRDRVPVGDRLAQVAEEACELAQAALKLKRVYEDTNPADMTFEDAYNGVMEEWADLSVACSVAFGSGTDEPFPNHPWAWRYIVETCHAKLDRWATRLTLHARGER